MVMIMKDPMVVTMMPMRTKTRLQRGIDPFPIQDRRCCTLVTTLIIIQVMMTMAALDVSEAPVDHQTMATY